MNTDAQGFARVAVKTHHKATKGTKNTKMSSLLRAETEENAQLLRVLCGFVVKLAGALPRANPAPFAPAHKGRGNSPCAISKTGAQHLPCASLSAA
jgi:hypothetical protein